MAVLSDSTEVFDFILQQLQSRHLEAFLQVSKSLRRNFEWLLREHFELKRTSLLCIAMLSLNGLLLDVIFVFVFACASQVASTAFVQAQLRVKSYMSKLWLASGCI